MLPAIAVFCATLLLTVWLLLKMSRRGAPDRYHAFSLLLLVWLALTGALAYSQVLADFPPLLPICVLIAIGSVTFIARTLGAELPLTWLIGYQAFRVPVEIFLHLGYGAGFVPEQMTWHGRNWDILTGLSALPIAWLASRNLWAARVWNIAGFALLLNIMTIAFLSFPTPLRQFHNDPANVFVAQLPFVWLPTILVPAAWFGHIALFRRLSGVSSTET